MRVAVVGLGFMGATHLRAIHNGAAELAAVVSGDAAKLAGDLSSAGGNLGGAGEQVDFSAVKKYSTLIAALEDPEIDAVDLCLPTDLHEDAAIDALRHGKHVLVEKPMALDARACGRMIEEARRAGRVLMVAQVLRFSPAYTALAHVLPEIGRIRGGVFRRRCAQPGWGAWLVDKSRSGGGVFDLLIHDVDMALHLFGAPSEIVATGCEDLAAGIDTISAQLFYAGGCVIEIAGGWHHAGEYPFSMEYTLVADRGTVEYHSAGRAPTLFRAGGGAEALRLDTVDGYHAEIEYFAACCRSGEAPERCSPESSAEAVRLTRALSEARSANGERVKWKSA
jgi:predicted dehydrogenase